MPHIAVKMFPGRTDKQRQECAKVVEAAKSIFGSSDESLSVAIPEVDPAKWDAEVYGPDIQGNEEKLYKRPGELAPERPGHGALANP